jgi:hypothetical protein
VHRGREYGGREGEVSEAKKLFLCFVCGLNVFGRGKISISEQESRISSAFERSGRDIKFIVAHTNTGNLAVAGSAGIAPDLVRQLIREALGKPCAVVEPPTIDRMAAAFDAWPPPPRDEHQRWTPGFALLCEGHTSEAALDPTKAGVFQMLDSSTVLTYRRDLETPRGVLDNAPRIRAGGWGAISARVDRGLGGLWTARSFAIGRKLLEQARSDLE